METTRHYTGTVYLVDEGATALHTHSRHGITIPPGGHVERGELPHEAALREAREETGLDPTLVPTQDAAPRTGGGRPLPRPRHQMLYDVDVLDGAVAHQHVDHIYYATVSSREVDPGVGEAPADEWDWYTVEDLRAGHIAADVRQFGAAAIRAARGVERPT